ncbi:MAG: RNA-binding protein [Armatimonadetes bacterium]|nr:RNA-binding protein [Armatimonadota bacterium]
MAVTLYVGNLPWTVTEDELAKAFGKLGPVGDVRIIADHATGRSRGYGFVEVDGVSLDEAIEKMAGVELRGRRLTVGPARPRPPRH